MVAQNTGLINEMTALYSAEVELLLQQMTSRLRGKVSEQGGLVGKMAAPVTQYGSVVMKAPTGLFAPLNHTQPNSIRPWIFPIPGSLPQLIDSFQQLETIVDPKNAYAQAAAAATGRYWDDGVIAAFFAARSIGVDIGALTSDTFSTSSFQVASIFGSSAASGLTIAKIIEARRILEHYHNDLEMDQPGMVIGSQQHSDLYNQVQVVSTEFQKGLDVVISGGKIRSILGVQITMSERLSVASNVRNIPLFVKSGMRLGMWKDMENRVDERVDLEGTPWQLLTKTMYGAVRMQAGKVTSILCSDSTGVDITP